MISDRPARRRVASEYGRVDMVTSNMDKKKAKEKEAQMNGFKQTKDQLGTNPNPYLKSYFPSKLSFWWVVVVVNEVSPLSI